MIEDHQCVLLIKAEPEVLDAIIASLAARVLDDRYSPDQILLPFDAESDETAALMDDVKWVNKQLSFTVHAPLKDDSLAARRRQWGSDSDARNAEVLNHDPGRQELTYGFRVTGQPPLPWLGTFAAACQAKWITLTVADTDNRTFTTFNSSFVGDGQVRFDSRVHEMEAEIAEVLSEPSPNIFGMLDRWPL